MLLKVLNWSYNIVNLVWGKNIACMLRAQRLLWLWKQYHAFPSTSGEMDYAYSSKFSLNKHRWGGTTEVTCFNAKPPVICFSSIFKLVVFTYTQNPTSPKTAPTRMALSRAHTSTNAKQPPLVQSCIIPWEMNEHVVNAALQKLRKHFQIRLFIWLHTMS